MDNFTKFSKIFAVGSKYIPRLFDDEVEITEKIDGSQFRFGVNSDGKVVMASKNNDITNGNIPKMFSKAADYVYRYSHVIEQFDNDTYFYGEYLEKPKHNVLNYERVPKNNIMLYGVKIGDKYVSSYDEIKEYADKLDLEVVPIIYTGKIENPEQIEELLDRDSVLGGEKIEGIVIKNYNAIEFFGNMPHPSFAKYVSEKFKERHNTKDYSGKNKLEMFLSSFRTEARWRKAVQHLKENGELENEPRDIGKLFKEVHLDIVEEEEKNIKEELYNLFIKEIKRRATRGLPEWYKKLLLEKSFDN